MQKTFDVWVKRDHYDKTDFRICSKRVESGKNKLHKIDKNDDTVDVSANVYGCDVSHWLETLGIEEDEVKSFKLTFKEN